MDAVLSRKVQKNKTGGNPAMLNHILTQEQP
jgi:hypothetical protein